MNAPSTNNTNINPEIRDDGWLLEDLPMQILFEFITPFNGDRRELMSFLTYANSVIVLLCCVTLAY